MNLRLPAPSDSSELCLEKHLQTHMICVFSAIDLEIFKK